MDTATVSRNTLAGPTAADVAPLKGKVIKVLFAFYQLEMEAGVGRGERFSASLMQMQPLTNLSHPVLGPARLELVRRGLILSYGEGVYALPLKKLSSPYPLRGTPSTSEKERVREREKKGVRALKNLAGGLTATERTVIVIEAFRLLRIRYNGGGKFAQLVKARLTRLLNDGFSRDEALTVVRWGREKYDAGDRFESNIDPLYLWSVKKFPVLLSAAQTPAAPTKGETSRRAQEWAATLPTDTDEGE